MPATRIYIKDMQPSQLVEGVYAIFNAQLGTTRGGKPYLKCLIADKTGRTPARMWNMSEELFSILPTDGFVTIEGETQDYQGNVQIIIRQINPVHPSQGDLAELLPCTEFDIDQMFDELCGLMESLKYEPLLALCQAFLGDEELMEKFRRAPAAMNLHHAFLGGLLEHTLQLLKLADAMLPLYPKINRDLVLAGLFLHDIGKTEELQWETGFSYSDEGMLIGHIVTATMWVREKAKDLTAFGKEVPAAVLMALQHIILSHHGRPEFGAVKIPSTPEAIFVSNLDNLDAKMQMAITEARGESNKSAEAGGNFTEKVWALETKLYRPDPTLEG